MEPQYENLACQNYEAQNRFASVSGRLKIIKVYKVASVLQY
jgi:hypothetical protein